MEFTINCIPPKHTAQASNRILKTKDGRYFVGKKSTSKARTTQVELFALLSPHAPEKPLEGPLAVQVEWVYPYRNSEPKKNRKHDIPCDKRPDIDNLCKLLFDIMTRTGFWIDDSQIAQLHFIKKWAEKPYIKIGIIPYTGPEY